MHGSRVNSDVGAASVLRLFVGLVHPPPKKFVLSNCDPRTGHGANVPKCRDDSDTCRQLWDNHAAFWLAGGSVHNNAELQPEKRLKHYRASLKGSSQVV